MLYRFTLSHTSGTDVLTSQPKGWDQIEFIAKRDATYIGMFFEMTIKLDFICNGGGKEFIDDIYDTYGVDADITILIEQDCDESGTYEEIYTGTLDLETYQRTYTQPEFTTVGIVQNGPLQTIKSRLDTKIDLTKLTTLDGTTLTPFTYGPYELNLHSKAILASSKLSSPGGDTRSVNENVVNSDAGLNFPMIFTIEYDELATPSSYTNFPSIHPAVADPLFTAGETDTYDISYNIDGEFSDFYDMARSYNLSLAYSINGIGVPIHDFGSTGHGAGSTSSFPLNYSGTLSIAFTAGDTFSIYIALSSYSASTDPTDPLYTLTLNDGAFLKITKQTVTAATTANAFVIHEAFARISQSIINSTDCFRSNYFGRKNSEPNSYSSNGCGAFAAITNGFQIRQFLLSDRPPMISFKELFESSDAIHNLGMGIDQIGNDFFIRVEPKEYFFSTDVLFQIPNIKGYKKSIATDYYFNEFTCGFEAWQQDGTQGVNGLDEFNTKRTYTLGLKKISTKVEKLSKLIAGAYPLEITRRKSYVNFPTTNFQYDDSNFIICLNRSVDGFGVPNTLTTAEKDENYPGTTGILDPSTIYNLRLSPGRILRRWLKWISPLLVKNNAILKDLKFSYGEGNYTMVSTGTDSCDSADGTINEASDVEVLVTNANPDYEPIFIPEISEFNAELSLADYKLIRANPTKCIEISTSDTGFIKAYILEVRYKPTRGIASFKMLLSNS